MVLRRMPAGRGHVARLAVVSLVSLGLVGLSGAANADKPGDRTPSSRPSGARDLCLPRTPVDDLHLPVDLPSCLKQKKPSADPSSDTSDRSPSRHHRAGEKADPGGPGPICVPLPADLKDQLPSSIPTCLPKCVYGGLLRTLQNLPDDTLNELLGDVTQTLGELPDCLLSLLPKPAPSEPPGEPSPSPTPTHTHSHEPNPNPTITSHVPSTAGPAKAISGNPDFTG